ncbi:hypothetical protein BJ508DRAFT_121864 [Ascobolus immersus RN42]|uniref:Uncharacterized protein n=1 Tax=Ascobolus immersus RN42 TaxID=1160509 RepID=A0A3N4INB2_ASCIM|nr:hypothetical protein BJ508DRAFT_121864 [Ascobolus immersus RN42]
MIQDSTFLFFFLSLFSSSCALFPHLQGFRSKYFILPFLCLLVSYFLTVLYYSFFLPFGRNSLLGLSIHTLLFLFTID